MMALVDVCACARAFRVVVVVLIFSVLVGLSQHVLIPERDDLQISQEIVGPAVGLEGFRSKIPGVYEDSVKSTSDVEVHPTVRSVALKNVVAQGETLEDSNQESFVYGSEEVEGSSWNLPESAEHRTIGKRMIVPRGRSLRITKRPPIPCTLPSGATCQPQSQSCCGNACVTFASDPSHCGRCGHMCSAKRECCSGKCRRLATDEKNCGRCGTRCAPGVKCLFGLCGYSS